MIEGMNETRLISIFYLFVHLLSFFSFRMVQHLRVHVRFVTVCCTHVGLIVAKQHAFSDCSHRGLFHFLIFIYMWPHIIVHIYFGMPHL